MSALTPQRYVPEEALLCHHGDADAAAGLVDLAVNVRSHAPPGWLTDRLAAVDLSRYPDVTAGRAAVADRHGRGTDEVLLTAGAAEAFVLLARAFAPRRAVVVHPQFTEPEVALRAAGHEVERVVLDPPFTLDPELIPADADLVVVGNPTNPTSVLHPAATMKALTRPGRVLVVDEAFADCVPGEPESLAAQGSLAGLVVIRSLTKTWGLAGLRAGYVLAEAALIAALAQAQPRWAVSAPALVACALCCTPPAVAEATDWARTMVSDRGHLIDELTAIPGVEVLADPQASFILLHVPVPRVWKPLRHKGFAVRRADTFPGLGPDWIRVAVRDRGTSTAFATALRECV